ncbi:acetolactate synthase-1/2/3 large subunit [Streptomyces sp. Ag109_O5-1]|uniref:thiamine pyrophosphate-binding protein n=1 Tax=Streptomyces sp. Ag109_O5-1 TaxID=1938851 RepID=UPI000F4E48F1|nr:thiamine pyrophosphate-binding protein [Streptomyces sp. Ag109_O5-1]RPE27047.1 acetolactate synthase-1/2/3 large subunit [Streptomyces sp. Ag109_O5-1]
MVEINAGQAIVNALRAEGVSHVFGMPGGHVLPLYDAIHRTPGISSFLVRHEHHAAAMAAAYAQLTGRPAVVLVTAGPGVTNTLTAVAEAYVGALPMIVLGGRGATATAHRGASQEVATDQVFAPVTKWSVRVDRADLLTDVLRQGFARARGGRPGPVLIDIPRDLLTLDVPDKPYLPVGPPARPAADQPAVDAAAAALAGARSPLIIAGGGVASSGAFDELRALAERLSAPVLTSLAGRGSLPDDHPLAAGGLGAHRNPVAKRLLGEADVVLGLGTRFEEMETNWQPTALPSPDATYIQVDIDPAELGRAIPAHIPVNGDIKRVLEQLLTALSEDTNASPGRTERLLQDITALDAAVDRMALDDRAPIHPARVIRTARSVFPRDTVLGVDVGALAQHIGGAFPFFRVYQPRSVITPSSFYGMGFAAAALPAARLVHPRRPALCFVGDGSFQMVMNIVPMAAQYGLAVTWCVLNDDALGSIRDLQEHTYGNRIQDTEFPFQPDFARLAEACGAYGERVDDPAAVPDALKRALAENAAGRPAVLDFAVARTRLAQTKEHYFTTYPQDE